MKTKIFAQLLRESVLIQAVVTLILTAGMVYMYATSKPIPQDFLNLQLLIIGFWFGSKSEARIRNYIK